MVLTALYSLLGVPIFGLALGRFAGVLVDRHMARKNHRKMTEKISHTEAVGLGSQTYSIYK